MEVFFFSREIIPWHLSRAVIELSGCRLIHFLVAVIDKACLRARTRACHALGGKSREIDRARGVTCTARKHSSRMSGIMSSTGSTLKGAFYHYRDRF